MELRLTPAAIAHGFGEMLPPRMTIPARLVVGNGRAERGCPSLTHDAPRFRMINATPRQLLLADEAQSA